MLICTNEDCGTENRDEATYCTKCGTLLLNVVGAYRVLELIGKGANGAVYRAEHCQRPGEIRALKAVFKQADIASLKAKFEVLKDLRHPNLPRYDAWFEHQGYGYLVMEFVPGQNLELLLAQRRGPLSPWVGYCDGHASAYGVFTSAYGVFTPAYGVFTSAYSKPTQVVESGGLKPPTLGCEACFRRLI